MENVDVARLFQQVANLLELRGDNQFRIRAYRNAARTIEAMPKRVAEIVAQDVERCRALGDRGLTVVSPDPGGFHRAEALRDALERVDGATVELAMLGKHRKGGVVRTEAFVGDVEGRIAVIVDDMIATGTTLVRAAEACRKRGATAVHAMATHGVFTATANRVLATPLIDSILITDTVSPDRVDLGVVRDKLTIVSVAPLLARAISTLHHERSMAAFLDEPTAGTAASR